MPTLPLDFETYTRELLGERLFSAFTTAVDTDAPVSIRLNPHKCNGGEYKVTDADEGVPWCPYGFYLKHRPNFTFDPLLHAGLYYVQEAASMFVFHAVCEVMRQMGERGQRPLTVLDLCAAPGGKTTCLTSALPKGSIVYSNEPIRSRAAVLYENVQKWGANNVHVTSCYARDYAHCDMMFDIILTDVPCSGEGMFRKDTGAIADWSTAKVEQCTRLQRDIITDIWPCLKPGGFLIYSTCTLNAHENEENIEWIAKNFDAEHIDLNVEHDWNGIITNGSADYKHLYNFPFYRFMPGVTRTEGLFVSVLKRNGESKEDLKSRNKRKNNDITRYEIETTKHEKSPRTSEYNNKTATEKQFPLPIVNCQYSQAIAYLRGEAIVLPSDTPRGIAEVTFNGATLGKVKNIGNRANNLYPKEWRIKSTHIPSEYSPVVELVKG